jgi:hypothetical protein
LTVHEVSGWKTRGSDAWGPVQGITCHHTAGSRTSSIQGEINVLLNGSASAPPPIAQLLLARNGEWYVVASGTCFHNKVGWDGPNEGYGNDALLGIEAQHSGGDEPWTAVQYDSYVRGVAALVRHKASGWNVPVAHVAGHKEHQPGSKSDPTFSMPTFRTRVAAAIAQLNEEDEMVSFSDDSIAVSVTTGRELYDPDIPAGTVKPPAELLQLAAIWAKRGAEHAARATEAAVEQSATIGNLTAAIVAQNEKLDQLIVLLTPEDPPVE